MPTKFEICTNALHQIKAKPITDFAGGSKESQVAGALYQTTVDHWLSMYPWRFATKQEVLSRQVGTPTAIWTAIYSEPGDMITLQAVSVGGSNIPFDRFENEIYCDAGSTETVVGTFTYSINETYWPPYFVELVENALMEKFAFALPAKLDLKDMMQKRLETTYRMAKAADQRQQPSKVLPVRGRRSIMEARLG